MTTLELFRTLVTEFATVDDVTVQANLDNADALIAKNIIEALRNNLVVYYAAFMIDTAQRWSGSKGQVTSMTVGGVAINYQAASTTSSGSDDLDLSLYGRRYKALLKTATLTILTANV